LEWLHKHRKEFIMSQVQCTISFTVNPAPAQPLTVTPATVNETLQVGIPADGTQVAIVSGGVPPYSYTMDANSGPLPPGVSIVEDPTNTIIQLAGTPTTAGTSPSPV